MYDAGAKKGRGVSPFDFTSRYRLWKQRENVRSTVKIFLRKFWRELRSEHKSKRAFF
ncbi:MAG: hypothetical protein UW75_C0035G0007 [Parcubacteria group bacterium GW2011_GWF2_44_8]|nr:MAG: hypothetical protein UW75_C0035G0007 [Parcubacteria group bacterium GW2011_GWF2_44_8]